jgi:hypothetical protein
MVKIIKLRAAQNPLVPSSRWDTYQIGSRYNHESLPVDYEMVGDLMLEIEVGYPVFMRCVERNGTPCDSIFTSTPVLEITPDGFRTANSVYLMEPIRSLE